MLEHYIPKEKEGTYFEIPFEVPENVETVTVSYSYPGAGRGLMGDLRPQNTVDLGLCNEKGEFLGWSGSAHPSISVGRHASSPGYLSGDVNPGTWRILAGAYHVADAGVTVAYKITFTRPASRWFRGDLHVHSTASDGVFSPWELGSRAKKAGLDFIAVADHNNYAENLRLPFVPGVTFIPAVEWTHYKGHMNFFGVPAPIKDTFIANSAEQMRALVANAKALGAAVSVNHPKCPFCPYLWDDDTAFDLMEIWNGPFTPRNARAVTWWHSLLLSGRRVPAVGGSDFHKPGPLVKLGGPTTHLFAASPAPADLLDAMRAGRAYITESPRGPRLALTCGDLVAGDTAVYNKNVPVTAKTDARNVTFVTDTGETRVRAANGEARFSAEGARFVYAKIEAALPRGRLLAISNPIYFKEET